MAMPRPGILERKLGILSLPKRKYHFSCYQSSLTYTLLLYLYFMYLLHNCNRKIVHLSYVRLSKICHLSKKNRLVNIPPCEL